MADVIASTQQNFGVQARWDPFRCNYSQLWQCCGWCYLTRSSSPLPWTSWEALQILRCASGLLSLLFFIDIERQLTSWHQFTGVLHIQKYGDQLAPGSRSPRLARCWRQAVVPHRKLVQRKFLKLSQYVVLFLFLLYITIHMYIYIYIHDISWFQICVDLGHVTLRVHICP